MEKRFVRKCDAPGSVLHITQLPPRLCTFDENALSYGDMIVNLIVCGEAPPPVVVPTAYDSPSDVEDMVVDMASDITVSRLDMMAHHLMNLKARKADVSSSSAVSSDATSSDQHNTSSSASE